MLRAGQPGDRGSITVRVKKKLLVPSLRRDLETHPDTCLVSTGDKASGA